MELYFVNQSCSLSQSIPRKVKDSKNIASHSITSHGTHMEAINIWPTSSSFNYSIQQSQENVSKEDTTTYHQPHLHLFLSSSSLLRCICLLFSMCHNVICLLSPVITPVLVTVDSFRVLVVVRRNYSGRVSVHCSAVG